MNDVNIALLGLTFLLSYFMMHLLESLFTCLREDDELDIVSNGELCLTP